MKDTGILKHLGISAKVVAVGLSITGLFVITTFTWIIPGAEKAILERKREKIKEATETAWSVMLYYQSLVDAKELQLEEAQSRAASVIKNMRYGPEMKDYFWINDMRPYMVMHPYRADLDGKSLENFKDPNGVALFVEAAETCRRQGAGFVSYSWQWKDDKSNVVPKISYVRLYRPWQWIVGTGMYIEDVRAEIKAWRFRVMIVSALVALLGIFLSWRIGQEVARRIRLLSRSDDDLLKGTARVWRLHTLVMIIIVPALALITVFWCARFYQGLSGIIVNGFDRKLGAISSTAGCFISGDEHETVLQAGTETHPLYSKYVAPMRRIREKTGLTYLYTQKLNSEKPFCNYVLDASLGDDHSEIGYKDELPMADFQGAENVMLYGVIHKGNVEPTEGWGLIKVCYAPIYNDDDTITCMAGADVNISAINAKTRTGLFSVGLLAVCVIFGTGYISFLFSKRFGGPISELRDAALMIAGGNHDYHVDVTEPQELIRVSSAFNRIGGRLKETLEELETADRHIMDGNIRNDLLLVLDKPWTDSNQIESSPAVWVNNGATQKTASGCVTGRQNTIVWLGNNKPDSEALKDRCETAAMMSRTADENTPHCETFERAMRGLVKACFIRTSSELHAIAFQSIDLLGIAGSGAISPLTLEGNAKLAVQPFKWLIVSDAPSHIEKQAGSTITELMQSDDTSALDILKAIEDSLRTDGQQRQIFVSILEVPS